MRHALAGGGKRVRPVLCLATAEAAGATAEAGCAGRRGAGAGAQLLARPRRPACARQRRAAPRSAQHLGGLRRGGGDPRRRRAPRRSAAARALLSVAGGRARARPGDAGHDRRPVPRRHGAGDRPGRVAPAEDRLPLLRLGRMRALGRRRFRSESRRRGGRSRTRSACSSRSWTTSSTRTATCSSTAPTERTRAGRRGRASARRRRLAEIPGDTSVLAGIVSGLAARTS